MRIRTSFYSPHGNAWSRVVLMKTPHSASSTAETSDESWETREVLENAKHELQERFTDVRDAAAQTVHGMRATATTTAAVARDGYQALRHDAVSHFGSYREEWEHHIRQEPLKAVGLAALTGLVIGLLARR
jgi:ElaB/YqjD/DUF883 family membrane-anchored ribosome-binding protein